MPLSKEQLLIPRYKCIALWMFEPKSSLGAIYEQPNVPRGGQWTSLWLWWDEMANHPHLFQPLPWWSDRKPEDMEGLFIKSEQGYCYKIDCHFISDDSEKDPEPYFYDCFNINGWYYFQLEPTIITEEEYTAYINQNK